MKRVTLKNPFGGMTQWLYQRFTAFFMIFYFAIIGFYLTTEPFNYSTWNHLMSPLWMRINTTIFFLLMIIHAWIGVQHVTDDYIKPVFFRGLINCALLMLAIIQIIYLSYCLMGREYV